MVREVEITNALTDALAHDRLEVHYQPIVSLADGQILAVEALVRWHDPDEGWISPSEFIPIAEGNGLIGPLGEFVLERAACQMSRWRSLCPAQLPLGAFINVSPHQLAQPGFVDRVAGVLDRHGLGTGDIGIEVTEGVFIDDTGGTVGNNLAELARRGVRLSLDDFGTGYSALASLKRFPFSILKIDRFFIGSIRRPDDAAPITSSVVALGRTLGMTSSPRASSPTHSSSFSRGSAVARGRATCSRGRSPSTSCRSFSKRRVAASPRSAAAPPSGRQPDAV